MENPLRLRFIHSDSVACTPQQMMEAFEPHMERLKRLASESDILPRIFTFINVNLFQEHTLFMRDWMLCARIVVLLQKRLPNASRSPVGPQSSHVFVSVDLNVHGSRPRPAIDFNYALELRVVEILDDGDRLRHAPHGAARKARHLPVGTLGAQIVIAFRDAICQLDAGEDAANHRIGTSYLIFSFS